MRTLFSRWFSRSAPTPKAAATEPLDYDQWIHFDAEDLAETGIAKAYRRLLPVLATYVASPAEMTELVDQDLPSYKVQCDGEEYVIWSAEEPGTEQDGWARATYFLFHMVNQQLTEVDVRFYAIGADNDLGGMFLTPERAESAQNTIPNKSYWPYLPELDGPWYGMFH